MREIRFPRVGSCQIRVNRQLNNAIPPGGLPAPPNPLW